MKDDYRTIYSKAKSLLAKKYKKELHDIMKELGYVKGKATKVEVKVDPTTKVQSKPEVAKIATEAAK